jgi:hypothetical protein
MEAVEQAVDQGLDAQENAWVVLVQRIMNGVNGNLLENRAKKESL